MNWYDRLLRRQPKYVIPNPRDKIKRKEFYGSIQRNLLHVIQFCVFVLAILILIVVSR